MSGRIEAIDQELKKLTQIVLRLAPLAQQELLNYRTLETQHSQLQERNQALSALNVEAEEKVKKAVETADLIVAEARKQENGVKAGIETLYARANVKYKELEARLIASEKEAIKRSLKELEKAAA